MLRLIIFHPSRSGNVRMVNIVDRPDNRYGAQYQIKAKKNQVYSCRQALNKVNKHSEFKTMREIIIAH